MSPDTPEYINLKQSQSFLSKPLKERFKMGLEMIDDGIKLVECGIKSDNPGISDIELKIKVFTRLYKNDFSDEELEKIIQFFYEKNSK